MRIYKPSCIPASPQHVYPADWTGIGNWLGTQRVANKYREFLPFKKARILARSLNLKSGTEWFEFAHSDKRPVNIPVNPAKYYKGNGWVSMHDWLGTGKIHHSNIEYLPFEEARKFARSLNLKTFNDWYAFCRSKKKPKNIPTSPDRIYKNKGWISVGDWLGNGYVAVFKREFLPFEQARAFVHTLGIKNKKEWKQYIHSASRDPRIPTNPNVSYKDSGWDGFANWLGTNEKRVSK